MVDFVPTHWLVLASLVNAQLLHRFIQLLVFFMALLEFFDYKFLEQADIDNIEHRHDLAQDLYTELTCNGTITVFLKDEQECLYKVPPCRAGQKTSQRYGML